MSDPVKISITLACSGDAYHATVTPEIARQIVALSGMDARIEKLERHYHHLRPQGQTALPVTDEGPVAAEKPMQTERGRRLKQLADAIPADQKGLSLEQVNNEAQNGPAPVDTHLFVGGCFPAPVAADKPGCFSDWHRDMATNRACGACNHQTACKADTNPEDQPAGDDAAPADLAAAISAAHDGPLSDEHAATLLHYVRFDAVEISRQRYEITDLRAKLALAELQVKLAYESRDRADDIVTKVAAERDKALTDLAAMTERAERREWINLENCESVKARLAGYLLTKELVAVERLDAEKETSQHLSDIIASRDAAIMNLEKEIVEATRQKDICRLDAIKLRDMLEASKNGHWYGRTITAETQAVDLKQERDAARAELAGVVALLRDVMRFAGTTNGACGDAHRYYAKANAFLAKQEKP